MGMHIRRWLVSVGAIVPASPDAPPPTTAGRDGVRVLYLDPYARRVAAGRIAGWIANGRPEMNMTSEAPFVPEAPARRRSFRI